MSDSALFAGVSIKIVVIISELGVLLYSVSGELHGLLLIFERRLVVNVFYLTLFALGSSLWISFTFPSRRHPHRLVLDLRYLLELRLPLECRNLSGCF